MALKPKLLVGMLAAAFANGAGAEPIWTVRCAITAATGESQFVLGLRVATDLRVVGSAQADFDGQHLSWAGCVEYSCGTHLLDLRNGEYRFGYAPFYAYYTGRCSVPDELARLAVRKVSGPARGSNMRLGTHLSDALN